MPLPPYRVDVVAIGVLDDEPELMSVGAAVPEAPMEVPLPVEPVADPVVEPVPVVEPAVVSVLPVLGVVPMEDEPVVLPVVLLGEVVEGVVLEVEGVEVEEEDDEPEASSFLPHALKERAASRARAAHCAMGDLIIRIS